jgi:propionyl-CoA carboxylase beta chain
MAGMGETPDKEELGGARMQARAGAVDNVAADEDDALAQIKRFLTYLPENVWEPPPLGDASDPSDRREEELLSIVPRDQRRPYKMRRVLEAVLDRGSLFELGAAFGRPTITCLARLGGRPVGVIASDPEHYGGGVTADAGEKTARFVDTGDQFHLPVVNFVDVPGFVIGTAAERAGTIRRGSRGCSPSCRRASRGCRFSCARCTAWRAPATATARG